MKIDGKASARHVHKKENLNITGWQNAKLSDVNRLSKFKTVEYLEEKACKELDKFSDFEIPKPNQIMRFMTTFRHNPLGLITHYIDEFGSVDEVVIFMYQCKKVVADLLLEYVRLGKIKHMKFLICKRYAYNYEENTFVASLANFAEKYPDKLTFKYPDNHAKIVCIDVGNGIDYPTITGSGNLTLNARVENYIMENCKDSFDFYNNFFDSLKNDK